MKIMKKPKIIFVSVCILALQLLANVAQTIRKSSEYRIKAGTVPQRR